MSQLTSSSGRFVTAIITTLTVSGIAAFGIMQISNYSEYAEVAAPATPAAGKVRTYAKADGKMYSKDDAGLESLMGGGGGGVTGTGVNGRVSFWDSGTNLSSDTNLFWDDTNNRLGVGTATPGYLLEARTSAVSGAQPAELGLIVSDQQGTPRRVGVFMGGGNDVVLGSISSHVLNIITAGVPRIAISAAGLLYVGNGTAVAEKLEVDGAIKIGTALGTQDGTIRWTGTDFEGRKSGVWTSFTFFGSDVFFNTKAGTSALDSILTDGSCLSNTAFGTQSGTEITNGDKNTAYGSQSLSTITTGNDNTAIGQLAMIGTQGASSRNTAVGQNVFGTNTTFDDSTGVGYKAGYENGAADNCFFGSVAGSTNTTGTRNVIMGKGASNTSATSNDNVHLGYQAGTLTNNSSNSNTFVGASAGDAVTSGSSLILLGRSAQPSAVSATNEFVAGSGVSPMTNIFFGKGPLHATPASYTVNGTGGSGTNIAGEHVLIAGGRGTGTANSGYVGATYPLLTTTGTTLQSMSTLKNYFKGVIYTSTVDATKDNTTTTESTIIGAQTNAVPQGTLTLDANLLRVGTTIVITAHGIVTTDNSAAINVRAKLGSVTVAETGDVTPPISATNRQFSVSAMMTCRSTGATGTVQGNGYVLASADPSTSDTRSQGMYKAATTVDTTAAQVIDLTLQWSGTGASSLMITNVTVELR